MTIYLLRHAEKEIGDFYNPKLRHQDQPLSLKGKRNSVKLINYFMKRNISSIYVSEYQRTWQTIESVADILKITPIVDKRLNELDNGLVNDMDEQQFRQAYPEVWKAYSSRTMDFRFPGGETGMEAQQRIMDFLKEKLNQHKNENILLVSHDGLIRICMCYILDLPVFKRGDFQVDLCSRTEFYYQEELNRWKLVLFNNAVND